MDQSLATDNRRLEARYPATGGLYFRSREDALLAWARIRNVSVSGIGLLLDRHIRARTRLILQLSSPESGTPVERIAQVRYCTLYVPGQWLVGCRFETELSHEELRLLCNTSA